MDFNQMSQFADNETVSELGNFREELEKYLIHYKWFLLSIVICIVFAFFHLRKQVSAYEISSKILIKEKEKGSSVSDLTAFEDLGLFSSNNNSLENEIHILTSRRLMTKVVSELKLNVKYYIENSPYNLEQYPNIPFNVEFIEDSFSTDNSLLKKINNVSMYFKISIINNDEFEFFDSEDNFKGRKKFGNIVDTEEGGVVFSLNDSWKNRKVKKNIIVTISRLDAIVDKYIRWIKIEPIDAKSRVLNISLNQTNAEKGIAVINNLVEQYNADAIADKNDVYIKTTEFLDDRLILMTSELNAIESTVEQFKTSKGLIDTKSGADIFLQSSSTNENELIAANTELVMLNHMVSELELNGSYDLLPANIGLSDPSINSSVSEFNKLVLQRNRVLKSSTSINPLVINLDQQLDVLKSNLLNSLNTVKSSLVIRINALTSQGGKLSSRIASVPKNEKEFTDIVRQKETKNAVYLFLLQKREESILSNAISMNRARIVDMAYSNGNPVSPKPAITYFAAFLIGLLIPAGVIFIHDTLDTKVHNENDLKKLRIPYLGDVPLSKSNKNIFITEGDNSSVSEAFRYIRTNINFMLDSNKKGKTIFVTSTLSGEGKTFTSINLANSLALSGKRTLLLGMDLRAPKVTKYLDLEDVLGVTNFIKNENLTIREITETHTDFDNLDIINSGDIPPNPVELLMSDRVKELFETVKHNYDFIIVDTAPVGMVTDTIQLRDYADMTIYVIKANVLDKRMLHIPKKLYSSTKLPNMSILINGTDVKKSSYGYGYGYGKV